MKRKQIIAIGISFILGIGVSELVSVKLHNKNESRQVIETDKVKLEYIEIENGDFDILISSKGEYNISSEYNLDGRKYYTDGYIVGQTKENAEKIHEGKKKIFAEEIDWELSWNN